MGVGRNVCHPVALFHSKFLQCIGPAITAFQKFCVTEPQITIHHRLSVSIKVLGATGKFHWGECRFHNFALSVRFK